MGDSQRDASMRADADRPVMFVFLLPLGGSRHELYCEVVDDDDEGTDGDAGAGWWARTRRRFRGMIADAEDEHARNGAPDGPASGSPDGTPPRSDGTNAVARWVVRKIAEAIAELRLLWHLRRAPDATLVHADDLDGRRALEIARPMFASDRRKHLRWCVVDAIISAVTGAVFFFVPGPNLIGWYFAFRAWGHFQAYRGAVRALTGLDWRTRPSAELTALAGVVSLADDARAARLVEVEEALGLHKLAAFVERVSRRPA
jgi:hypothetical protein